MTRRNARLNVATRSNAPTDLDEGAATIARFFKDEKMQARYRELAWALLLSSEFSLNH